VISDALGADAQANVGHVDREIYSFFWF
jgi:hypothetical protein